MNGGIVPVRVCTRQPTPPIRQNTGTHLSPTPGSGHPAGTKTERLFLMAAQRLHAAAEEIPGET